MKIGIVSNFSSRKVKKEIIKFFNHNNQEIHDLNKFPIGTKFATIQKVAKAIENGKIEVAIFIDDYAIAPFILANKHKKIICAPIYDFFSAKMAREHNNANAVCFATKINSSKEIISFVEEYFRAHFAGERHTIRVEMIKKIVNEEKK